MSTDIKATVAGLERQFRERVKGPDLFVAHAVLPSLLAELRRLWFIEEAAVRYRDARFAFLELPVDALTSQVDDARAAMVDTEEAIYLALPPRKEGT